VLQNFIKAYLLCHDVCLEVA